MVQKVLGPSPRRAYSTAWRGVAIFAGGNSEELRKGAIEGAAGVEAGALTDSSDAQVRLLQQTTGARNTQGIDVIVKADVQFFGKEM